MKRFAAILIVIFFIMGCATWRDREGNQATSSEEFDCNNKCGSYNTKTDGFPAICFNDCMKSKGYRQIRD